MSHDNGGNVDIMMSGVGANQQGEHAHTTSFGSANINKTDKDNIYHESVYNYHIFIHKGYRPTWIAITIHDVYNNHMYYMQVTMQYALHLPCISSQQKY